MDSEHRPAGQGSCWRTDSRQRKWKRVRIILEAEYQSSGSFAPSHCPARATARAPTDVSSFRDADPSFDHASSTIDKATALQDRGYGRVDCRGSDRRKGS